MSEGSPTYDGRAVLEPPRSSDRAPRTSQSPRAWLMRSAPWLVALAVYIVAAVAVTWPVAADPAGTVFGAPGDSTGNITLLRYRNDLGVGPLSNAVTHEENAPFGVSLPGATSLPQIAIEGPMQAVAAVTGSAVLAYNLAVLSGVILSAFACFLLCRHITGNAWAAGVAGVGFGFNPWMLARAGGHVHFTHAWSLCLIVLALLMIREGRGRPAWLLLAGATVFGLYTNTYFALFIGVILASFLIADVGAALWRRPDGGVRAAALRGGAAFGIYLAALVPQAVVSLTQRATIDNLLVGTRSPGDSYIYGSRWWEWIVPSENHPVFSEWTGPFRLSHLHMSNPSETDIYLGVSMLVLAAIGVVAAVIARRRGTGSGWTAVFAGSLVVVAFITSLPSHVTVLGRDIPMPAAALYHVVEPWRVYARLFIVVAIGVAMLAAIGVAWLLGRLPARTWPVAAAALAALVAFDLAARHTHFSAANTPIYNLLAEQKDDAPRVEYPLLPPTLGRHLAYIFYTQGAKHPLMNGGRPGTVGGSIQGRLQDPSRSYVAPALAALGVRWAIVHGDAYAGQPVPVPGAGFRLVGRSTTDSLYRVVADPAPAVAVPRRQLRQRRAGPRRPLEPVAARQARHHQHPQPPLATGAPHAAVHRGELRAAPPVHDPRGLARHRAPDGARHRRDPGRDPADRDAGEHDAAGRDTDGADLDRADAARPGRPLGHAPALGHPREPGDRDGRDDARHRPWLTRRPRSRGASASWW